MNSIYRSNIDGELGEMVWLDGKLFVSAGEEKMLNAVLGQEVIIAVPYPPVIADTTMAPNALASFVAAFPEDYWETIGEDFVYAGNQDDEDTVY